MHGDTSGPGVHEPLIWYEGSNNATPRWLIADRQGSIIATTNAAGAETTYAYGPYGEPNAWTGSRFRYTGQIVLPELQLYHYKARVYDPGLRRFLQTDPVGYYVDLNLYAFVGNDPLNGSDPSGMAPCPDDETIDCAEEVVVTPEEEVTQEEFRRASNDISNQLFPQFFDAVTSGLSANAAFHCITGGACNAVDFIPFARLGRLGRLCCFVAGTLVHTSEGLRPIEQIEVGDFVLSRDEESGETAYKPVTATTPGHSRELWRVTFEIEPTSLGQPALFETTDDHPWRTVDGRWLRTDQLQSGALVARASGAPVRVLSVEDTGEIALTYNFEVADFHTYFVGDEGVWVHNCPPGDRRPMREGVRPNRQQNRQANDAIREAERRTTRRMTDDQREQFHDRIQEEGLDDDFAELVDEAERILNGQ